MEEQDLVRASLKGDQKAQKKLFDSLAPEMMTLCNRYSNSPAQAADMLQEGFIIVFQKLKQFKGSGSFKGWVRTIMVNSALTVLRKEKKFAFSLDIEEVYGAESSTVDAISQLSFQELSDLISKLPAGYRAVFNMYAIEGYSHREISEKLNFTESTSKTQYRKAKIYLQKLIAENE